MTRVAKTKTRRAKIAVKAPVPKKPESPRTDKFRLRQEAIIKSAVDVINCKGVPGVTFAEVAARLELVPTGIIYYFENKEELAAACFLKAIDTYNDLIDAAASGATSRERLGILVRRYFEFRRDVALKRVDPITVFNDVRALNDPRVNEAYVDMFRRARALLKPTPPRQVERPILNAHTHHIVSQLAWAVVWLPQYDPEEYERAGRRFLDILENGIYGNGRVWSPASLSFSIAQSKSDVSRDRFLRAATALINERGYLGASVDKISARLKLTKGSFYHHNDDKDGLVAACFERTVRVMRAVQRAAAVQSSSGWDQLCSSAAKLLEFQVSAETPLLRASALTSVPESIQGQVVKQFDRASSHFAAMISDGIADGSIRPIDANICAQMITGMLNGATELSDWVGDLSRERAGRAFLEPLFDGLAD